MSHLGNFTNGTHQVFTAEQHTRFGTKLTTHDIFIQTVVTVNDHTVDGSLRTFLNTHFQRDRVVIHIYFYRVGTKEYVTIIIIDIGYGIFICRQTFRQLFLVIHLTRLHSEDRLQKIRSVLRITHKTNVFQIILVPFFQFQEDIDLLLIKIHNTISQQYRVTITMFVIFGDNVLLIFFVFFRSELLRAECFQDTGLPVVRNTELFVRFLHRLLQVPARQSLIPLKVNTMNLRLFILIDMDIDSHFALFGQIITLYNIDVYILKTFAVKELLNNDLCTVHQIGSDLESLFQA